MNLKSLKKRIGKYKSDPISFMTEVLDVKPEHVWSKMAEIAESVRDNQFTAVPAGHAVSKSYLAGRLALWFKACFQPSTVITTAPSQNQIENQLWKEIHTAYQGCKWPGGLGGRLTTLQWDVSPSKDMMSRLPPEKKGQWEKNFAIGFATLPDTASEHATRMQGWHNRWLLIILDEAGGILPPIWRTILQSLITNERCKVLAIGNPTDPTGTFFNVCQKGSGWNVIKVSVRDTPNYIQDAEIIPEVAGRMFERNIIKDYGENSNEHKYRCLGEFPVFGLGSVFTPDIFEYQKRFLRSDYQYGTFDWQTGDFMPHEQSWGWCVLDGAGSSEFTIGVDTMEYKLSDPKDLLSKRDFNACVVLNRNTKRVAAVWHGQDAQVTLGNQVLGAAKHYNQAWVNPEIPQGMGVLQVLRDMKYNNIFRRQTKQQQDAPEDTDDYGYRTTTITRQWLVNDLRAALLSKHLLVQFERIFEEMRTFLYNKVGKPEHAPGKHDDLVLALALAIQADLNCPKNNFSEISDWTGDAEIEHGRSIADLATIGAYDDFDEDEYDEYEGWYTE